MLNLKIQMESINLSRDIVHENDTIRVSITTLPDGQKQAQTFEAKETKTSGPTFKIQMNDQTEKVVIVFRKKNILATDHIIASTTLNSKDIRIFNEMMNNEHHKISIYEPLQNYNNKNNNKSNSKNNNKGNSKNNSKNNNNKIFHNKNRRIVGTMEVEFTLLEEFQRQRMTTSAFSRIDPIMYNQSQGNTDFLFQDPISN